MGTYYKAICAEKKEFIIGHSCDRGAKRGEALGLVADLVWWAATGRWAGHDIRVINDATNDYDFASEDDGWKDVTQLVFADMQTERWGIEYLTAMHHVKPPKFNGG